MAKTYKAKTKDYEVDSISKVEIEETEDVIEIDIVSLPDYDTRIEHVQGQISYLQAKLVELQEERVLVDNEAKKVKLKEPEPEPEVI